MMQVFSAKLVCVCGAAKFSYRNYYKALVTLSSKWLGILLIPLYLVDFVMSQSHFTNVQIVGSRVKHLNSSRHALPMNRNKRQRDSS